MTQEPEADDVEELAREIRKIIESNRVFLERVNDEDYEDEDEEPDPVRETEPGSDDYEEL